MGQLFAGRFALIDQIGEGATGGVWRAYDVRQRRYCAAKVIRERNAGTLLRVIGEQEVRLTHPNVVCPYGWAADDDVLIAMDLVGGGSLATLIRDHGPLPPWYAVALLTQLLDALAHVHSNGLLHRDVKPANVLLEVTGTGAPHSRLGDFGIAQRIDGPRLTNLGQVIGTEGYLPPEALAGVPADTARDLYAAGVVGWQLLTGQELPPADGAVGARPERVPAALWAAVGQLMSPEPADRPVGADQARALAIRGVEAQPPASADPDEPPVEIFDLVGPLPHGWQVPGGLPRPRSAAPVPGSHRRGRAVTLGVAAIVLAALVVVVAVAHLDGGQPREHPAVPGQSRAPATASGSAQAGITATSTAGRPARSDIRAGEACGWQDVDAVETDLTGQRVRCVFENGAYTWRPAS